MKARLLGCAIAASLTSPALAACASAYVLADSPKEPGTEAGLVEAAALVDGTLVEAGQTPCVPGSAYLLCADFDTKQFEDFSASRTEQGGTLAVSTLRATSPARSMVATLSRRATGVEANALVEKTLVGWPRVRIAFDVYLDFPDWRATDKPIAIATISMGSSGARTGSVFFVNNTDGTLSVESEPSANRYFNPPAVVVSGRWTHVVLDFDPSTGKYLFSVDGRAGTRDFAPVAKGAGANATLSVGLTSYDPPSPTMRAHYDNVVIDLP